MRPTPQPPPILRDRLIQLLERMKSRRIVVIGDVMLDRYLIGDTERLSPEAPVPVVAIRETRSALGGAANVAANVAAIGAACRLVGAVGDDNHAGAIRAELAAARLEDRHLVQIPGRPTTTKTRVLARSQQVVRIDEEVDTPVEGQDQERLISTALAALVDADALVFEDYNKGTLTEALILAAMSAAKRRGIPVVVDPKFRNFFSFGGATVFKPNRRELEAAMGATLDLSRQDALQQALAKLEVDNLLLTLGRRWHGAGHQGSGHHPHREPGARGVRCLGRGRYRDGVGGHRAGGRRHHAGGRGPGQLRGGARGSQIGRGDGGAGRSAGGARGNPRRAGTVAAGRRDLVASPSRNTGD